MLDPSVLRDKLAAIMRSPPASVLDAARLWADAYATYAADATSCQALGPLEPSVEAAKAILGESLAVAFLTTDPASCAASLSQALTAFWLLPPMAFEGVTPGLVTGVAGTSVLQTALIDNWVANVVARVSADEAAVQHATVIDAFTRTVLVAHAPPSACAAPIE